MTVRAEGFAPLNGSPDVNCYCFMVRTTFKTCEFRRGIAWRLFKATVAVSTVSG